MQGMRGSNIVQSRVKFNRVFEWTVEQPARKDCKDGEGELDQFEGFEEED